MRSSALNPALGDLVQHGAIGPVWCDGYEILRRIFVTVRDRKWQEIAPQEWNTEVNEESRTASISARHIADQVDFEWRGTLHVTSDARELSFAFSGRALRDMEICRLGIVVLHPIESMIGARVSAKDSQAEHRLQVARTIAPQPMVNGIPVALAGPFSVLRIERSDFGELELRFEGDLFELEDQRNWGDASFKSYCTPLRLGFPRIVKAGTSIAHSVQLRFMPAAAHSSPELSRAQTLAPSARRVFPQIGREWRSPSTSARFFEKEPAWRHVLFPISGRDDNLAALRALLESVSGPNVEIGIEAAGELALLNKVLSLLARHRHRVARLFAYGAGPSAPLAGDVKHLRQVMSASAALADVPVFAATRGYFVEFNRAVPSTIPVSGIAFPLTATVHSDDIETIADNAATIRDIANTARELMQLPGIAIAPLAFYYPRSEPPRVFPSQLVFSWLAASLIQAALAGVTSLTLADDVVTRSMGSNESDAKLSLAGIVACSGVEVLPLGTSLPKGVHAAIFKSAERGSDRILAANLRGHSVLLAFCDVRIDLPGFGTKWIELGISAKQA